MEVNHSSGLRLTNPRIAMLLALILRGAAACSLHHVSQDAMHPTSHISVLPSGRLIELLLVASLRDLRSAR